MHQHFTLVPVTFDPGGQFGPLAASFLWGTRPPNMSLLPFPRSFDDRSTSNLSSSPFPEQAAQLAHNATADFGLFRLADQGWKQAFLNEWFTPSHTAILPSQWAQQVLGHNPLIATARHPQTGLAKSNPLHSNSPSDGLHVAGIHPTKPHPSPPLPAEHCHRLTVAQLADEWVFFVSR